MFLFTRLQKKAELWFRETFLQWLSELSWALFTCCRSEDQNFVCCGFFNRAFGLQTNGTLLQVVWKDSVDTAHPDRELNITGVKYEKKWCVVFCSSPDQFAEPLGSYYNSLLGDAGASCY
jgi:hypothetical protein